MQINIKLLLKCGVEGRTTKTQPFSHRKAHLSQIKFSTSIGSHGKGKQLKMLLEMMPAVLSSYYFDYSTA